jgi:hypothetical protein
MALTGTRVGAQTSIYTLAANQMPDNDKMLYLLKPYQTPLWQMTYFNQIAQPQVVINENGKFSWFEDEYYPYQTTVTNIAGGGTSEDAITGGTLTWINEGDVLHIEATDDLVYVDSIAGGNIDITILDGATNITACTSGYMTKVGSRNHEMATARTAVSTQEIERYNYCEIHSETVTQSGRKQAGENWTNGKSFDDEVTKKIAEMKEELERNFLFSPGIGDGEFTVSTDYRHTVNKGLYGFLTTNKTSFVGAVGEAGIDSFLASVFAKGSNERELMMGSDYLIAFNKIVKDKYQTTPVAKKYGVDVTQYITPFGKANVVYNPQMKAKCYNSAFAIDLGAFKLRYMADYKKGSRKFRIEEGVETPGTDGLSTKILFDQGIQVANEELHGLHYQAA